MDDDLTRPDDRLRPGGPAPLGRRGCGLGVVGCLIGLGALVAAGGFWSMAGSAGSWARWAALVAPVVIALAVASRLGRQAVGGVIASLLTLVVGSYGLVLIVGGLCNPRP